MATWVPSLYVLVMLLLFAYWEIRYRTGGPGRGWMRGTPRPPQRLNVRNVDPEEVWGDELDVVIPVKRVPREWEFDLAGDLPPR